MPKATDNMPADPNAIIDLAALQATPFNKLRIPAVKASLRHYGTRFKADARKRDLVDALTAHLLGAMLTPANAPPAVRIQAAWRGHHVRETLRLRGPAAFSRGLCNNAHDPVSLEDVAAIPMRNFFSFRDADGKVYGFELDGVQQLLERDTLLNPFNRLPLPPAVLARARACLGIPRPGPPVPQVRLPRSIEQRAFEVFHDVYLTTGCFAEESWYLSLRRRDLIDLYATVHSYVVHNLYNAELPNQLLDVHDPPFDDHYSVVQLRVFNLHKLRALILDEVSRLLRYPQAGDRSTVAMWFLSGLARVSPAAAHAMPFLA